MPIRQPWGGIKYTEWTYRSLTPTGCEPASVPTGLSSIIRGRHLYSARWQFTIGIIVSERPHLFIISPFTTHHYPICLRYDKLNNLIFYQKSGSTK